jgi:hypothetical protein
MGEAKITGAKDRLTDAMMHGTIDEETYRKKALSLDLRQMEISKARENQKSKQDQGRFAQVFLEHAKNLCQTYFFATESEKRQMLDLCFSNMSVFAKKAELQTKDWLVRALDFQLAPSCADHRAENRSCPELGELDIQGIIDGLDYQEARGFCKLCEHINGRARDDDLPKTTTKGIYHKAA